MDVFLAFWDQKKGLQPLLQTGLQKMRKMLQCITCILKAVNATKVFPLVIFTKTLEISKIL